MIQRSSEKNCMNTERKSSMCEQFDGYSAGEGGRRVVNNEKRISKVQIETSVCAALVGMLLLRLGPASSQNRVVHQTLFKISQLPKQQGYHIRTIRFRDAIGAALMLDTDLTLRACSPRFGQTRHFVSERAPTVSSLTSRRFSRIRDSHAENCIRHQSCHNAGK